MNPNKYVQEVEEENVEARSQLEDLHLPKRASAPYPFGYAAKTAALPTNKARYYQSLIEILRCGALLFPEVSELAAAALRRSWQVQLDHERDISLCVYL